LINYYTIELYRSTLSYGRFAIVSARNSFDWIVVYSARATGWLFLCFRREFAAEEDTLICFEVVCSHFLEENSLAAERLLHDIQLKHAEQKGISSYSSMSSEEHAKLSEELGCSFDLFVCIAMISLFRSCLFDAHDELEALEAIQQRQKTLDVRQVLSLAEQLFKIYCQQMASKLSPSSTEASSFEIID
jgi:hypothetical protein